MFGHRWTASFGEETDPDGVWLRCLEDLTAKDIGAGLNAVAVSGMEWPPTAPQFREMCLNRPVGNMPGVEEAYLEVSKFVRGGSRDYSLLSPSTYFAYRNLDIWSWRQLSVEKAERAFKTAYKAAIEHARKGGEFPDVPTAAISRDMPKPSGVISKSDRAKAKAMISDLLAMMRK